MSYLKPSFSHPESPRNDIGYKKTDYKGVISTLCAGCGHDSISASIVQACFELNIEPHKLAKLSGIGCSSKSPTYFLSNSHGFNSVHGRMPSIATGANLANKNLTYLGVSGDGDTASIGIGQFVHAIRRNVNMTYICMNNGCYGLTKGQDSATADFGSVSKSGVKNEFEAIDLVSMALQLKAGFVARSFSGDKHQLIPLIKAALKYEGFSFIDVISPCVTFNNNAGSTKSYDYVREYVAETAQVDFVPKREAIEIEYKDDTEIDVQLFDGSYIRLSKPTKGWNPNDRDSAMKKLLDSKRKGEILTGVLFMDKDSQDLHNKLKTVDTPLNQLSEKELCPGRSVLEDINNRFR